jgi:hypothetical protein
MDAASLLADPDWLPHRFDAQRRTVEFVRLTRAERRALPFLRESFLQGAGTRCALRLDDIAAFPPAAEETKCHFIFHSAFCFSTLLARALDVEGKAESLREPQVLSDLARGGGEQALAPVLALLARPRPEEAVLIKPSNLANRLIEPLVALLPQARAILLHAPLPEFLLAVARGGDRRRQWARALAASYDERPEIAIGPPAGDLEAAAFAWLQQHAQFVRLTNDQPASRIVSLDGTRLLGDAAGTLAGVARHFGLAFNGEELRAIAAGPVFAEHAKQPGRPFDATSVARENAAARLTHGGEIAEALDWAGKAAARAGLPMSLGSPLQDEAAVVGPEGFEPPT